MPDAAFEPTASGIRVRVRVQPRASRDELAGLQRERLWIRLTAPPVEGAANEACRSFLAGLLGVARRAVALEAGSKAREKTFHVIGDPSLLVARLKSALATREGIDALSLFRDKKSELD